MMNNKWFMAIHMEGVHGFIDKRSGNTDTTVYTIHNRISVVCKGVSYLKARLDYSYHHAISL